MAREERSMNAPYGMQAMAWVMTTPEHNSQEDEIVFRYVYEHLNIVWC
jgi:hypothetical protein